MIKKLLTLTTYCIVGFCYTQNRLPLDNYLLQLDSTTEYSFIYKEQWIDSLEVFPSGERDFLVTIQNSLAKSGMLLYVHNDEFVFIYPNRIEFERFALRNQDAELFEEVESVRIGDPGTSGEDGQYILSGLITNESNESLIGVNLLVDGQPAGNTNAEGRYSIDLKPGNYELQFSYIGLETEKRLITFYSSGNLNVSLFPDSELLDEVVVEGSSFEQNAGLAQVGVQKLSVAKLEKLPSFLGDVDVVKSATALPGVSVSGESSSYLNVRGGGNDQTLILMNNTTIYNPGHMLGFFSVFNGDFVSEMTLYKGNIPAKYGMRSSSVLDVKMNKWADKKLNVYGGLGIANSNLGIKTKLLDDKLDIHVGGRFSYVNWILDLVPDLDIVTSSIHFGDVNLSSRYTINEKNSVFASAYFGSDVFDYSNLVSYRWKTLNGQIKWTHLLNEDWILESEMLVSSLNNSTEELPESEAFLFENGIAEYSFKSSVNNDNWDFGIDVTNYQLKGGEITPTSANTPVTSNSIDNENLLNLSTYASYLHTMDNGLEFNPGLRLNYFLNYGPDIVNIYGEGAPFTEENIVGQKVINTGEVAHSQATLEPRLGINYRTGPSTIRAGYSRINQFLHLIANTVLINPSTVWKGSDEYIPHTKIDQYSLGYQYDWDNADVSVSIDGFYKQLDDAIDYRDGATLILNDHLEQDILRGDGTSYGFEFLISKSNGALSGLASYTYSRSFIEVNDPLQNVTINDGERYPFYSDRPHSVKASLDFKLSKKWTFSSNFTYVSGAPVSAPVAVFQIDDQTIPLFSDRNSARIPDYHRLDLVITLKSRIRKTKKNNDRWVLTLYNLYGRDNVATIFFSNQNNLPGQAFKLVNVGRMIPTLTYKFEF